MVDELTGCATDIAVAYRDRNDGYKLLSKYIFHLELHQQNLYEKILFT
ncbi:MAG: hypothetical protein HC907_27515 [Richelia sp. SM1_7_0]|nr:hypothetical protein [Richelia sp. SM1_7_0]